MLVGHIVLILAFMFWNQEHHVCIGHNQVFHAESFRGCAEELNVPIHVLQGVPAYSEDITDEPATKQLTSDDF